MVTKESKLSPVCMLSSLLAASCIACCSADSTCNNPADYVHLRTGDPLQSTSQILNRIDSVIMNWPLSCTLLEKFLSPTWSKQTHVWAS